jgi:DNA polymerase III subunit delta
LVWIFSPRVSYHIGASGLSALKISPFAVKDYSAALQRFQLVQVIRNISLLKQADLKLKGVDVGSEDESQILKELVFKLIVNG